MNITWKFKLNQSRQEMSRLTQFLTTWFCPGWSYISFNGIYTWIVHQTNQTKSWLPKAEWGSPIQLHPSNQMLHKDMVVVQWTCIKSEGSLRNSLLVYLKGHVPWPRSQSHMKYWIIRLETKPRIVGGTNSTWIFVAQFQQYSLK